MRSNAVSESSPTKPEYFLKYGSYDERHANNIVTNDIVPKNCSRKNDEQYENQA